jgi:hypothetical protein
MILAKATPFSSKVNIIAGNRGIDKHKSSWGWRQWLLEAYGKGVYHLG